MAFNVNRHWLVSRNNYFKWCKGGMKIIKFNSVEEVVSYVIEPN